MTLEEAKKLKKLYAHFLKSGVTKWTKGVYLDNIDIFFTWAEKNEMEINTGSIGQWIISMLTDGQLSPRTVRGYLGALNRFLTWCVVQNHIAYNPVIKEKLPKLPPTPKATKRTFTKEEYKAVLKVCLDMEDFDMRDACIVGYNTGLRLGDVANLKFSHINWKEEAIVKMPRKTVRFGKEVRIPMSPELFETLQARKENPDDRFPDKSDYVFPAFQLSYATRKHKALSDRFKYRCVQAKVPDLGFHCLRHTLVSTLANNDINYGVISSITGQTVKQIRDYHHVSIEAQRKAIQKIV